MGRRSRVVLLAALCGGAVAWAAPARANTPSGAELAARGHFQAGEVYFAQGEYRRAIDAFLAAREQFDRPELDFNLGLTYERVGDAARALEAYRRFLQRRPEAEGRAELEKRMQVLEARTGHIALENRPAATQIFLDRWPVELGADERVRATDGKHLLAVVRGGLHLQDREVRVSAGRVTRVALDRPPRSRWWIGLVVGGVAAAALGVGLGVGLTRNSVEPPRQGDLGVLVVP